MKKFIRMLLGFIFFICACTPDRILSSPTPTVDAVKISTETDQPFELSETCIDIKTNLEGVSLSSKLVAYKGDDKGVLDIQYRSFEDFDGEISPDGEKLAVYELGKEIRVTDFKNNLIISFPWNPRWTEGNTTYLYRSASQDFLYFRWWNNHKIVIPSLPVGSRFILDIDTGEISELVFPYSNEVYGVGGFTDIRNHYVSISPDFEKVIYASTMSHLVLRNDKFYGDGDWPTVVWTGISFVYDNPSWAPDSTKFVYAVADDKNVNNLYLVDSIMGGERVLTDLETYFHNPYKIWISQNSWSPDGKKIAFVAHVTQKEDGKDLSRLLVLDLESREIEDYCNPDPDNPYSTNDFSHAWSPDSKYIATDTTIVDLGKRQAYKFPDVYIIGWVGYEDK